MSPPHQRAVNHNHRRFFSVSAFMGRFSPEDVVAVSGVYENHRQHDDGSDQQQRLRFGRGSCPAKSNLEGHHIGPHANRDAEIARQKYPEAQ